MWREPHPVRFGSAVLGGATAATWLMLTGLFAGSLRAWFWLTVVATAVAWAASVVLMRRGDRGAAAGVGISAGVGGAVAFLIFVVVWAETGGPVW